jgi:hypothetical protein
MRHKCFVWLLLLAISIETTNAQDKNQLLQTPSDILNADSQEKINLHLDKPSYTIGDDIWFKAYVTAAKDNKPTTISGILYVELLEDNGNPVQQLTLPLQSGVSWGMLKTIGLSQEKKYKIRAYTRWMRNIPSSFYNEALVIQGKTASQTVQSNKPSISFFPEGGKLIDGIPTKVILKIAAQLKTKRGVIVNQSGDELASFDVRKNGLTHFFITPKRDEKYFASVTLENGETMKQQLPLVQNSGALVSVRDIDTNRVSMRIYLTQDLLKQGNLILNLKKENEVLLSTNIPADKPTSIINIPINDLVSGILRISLISNKNEVLSERPIFITSPLDKINVNILDIKEIYNPKEEATFTLFASQNATPIRGSFSVAVNYSDKAFDEQDTPENWKDYDDVLLSQNTELRQFETIASPPKYTPEKNLEISGKVGRDKKPSKGVKVSLYSITGPFITMDTISGNDGGFTFSPVNFFEGARFAIKANGAFQISIDTDSTIYNIVEHQSGLAAKAPNADAAKLATPNADKKVTTLKQVEIVGKTSKASPMSSNMNGPGMADQVFNAKDMERSVSLEQFIDTNVPSLQRVGDATDFKYYLRRNAAGVDEEGLLSSPDPVIIMVDGVPNAGGVENLSIDDVESLEVLKSAEYSAVYGASGGLIIITTKRGRSAGQSTSSIGKPVVFSPRGFSKVPDFRQNISASKNTYSTIFWNPNIITDTIGKATITYTHLETPGFYRIIITGIDADGNLARKIVTYEVK